ncbi:hypothetical protein Tco_0061922 [Tanacetum coccineum]
MDPNTKLNDIDGLFKEKSANMLPVVCKNCRLTPQLHESAGGLPSLKLSLHSCSLPGSMNATQVSFWGGRLHFRSIRRFPFTKQGYLQFKDYELSRMIDAQKPQAYACKLQADDLDRMTIAIEQQLYTVNLGKRLLIKWDTLLKCAEKLEEQAEEMKLADALQRRANHGLMPWDVVLLHWNGVLLH